MSDLKKYHGVIPAFYACYDEEGNISPERVRGLTRHLIGKGVNGLYVGGSSGECIYQGVEERKVVLENVMAEVKGKRLVVLGAGGAATAICVQAALDGAAEIAIFNRGQGDFFPNGQRTVEKLRQAVPACRASITLLEDKDALARAVADCDILVNATRVGMKPLDGETLIDPALFRPELVVADTVYNPRETRMIQEAKAAGCRAAIGGIGMLLWQGVAAFKLFTGKDMPAQEVLEKFFS